MTAKRAATLESQLRAATIGRYDIYAEIGQGGMATVFLALDLALDRKVAIKVLNPQLATAPENVERFKREAKVAASLNHPNIIGIYAVGDDPELAYFVMKYVEGRALDSVVRETGAQSLAFVRGVIASAGAALHYAHTRGVVHRDVKPANFMLDKDGWLVVTDFGIAKMEDAKGLTITGSVIGTPYYMAPEQFQGRPITAAADQYALGVVAFELLTGRQPYAGDTIGEVMKGHLFDPIPSLRSLRPDVPAHIEAAVTRMLAKDPAERFASLEEAVAAFGHATPTQEQEVRTQIIHLAQSGAREQPQISVPLSPSPAVRTRPIETAAHRARTAPIPRQSHRLRTGLLVALALLVGGVGATALLRPDLFANLGQRFAGAPSVADGTGATEPPPSQPPAAGDAPAASGDPALVALAQAERDSIERAAAQAVLDSIARVDSARRADSTARADSIRRAVAAAERLRPTRRQIIRDSLAALAAARQQRQADRAQANAPATTPPAIDTAVAASQPPQTIPGSFVYGRITIGSRCPGAVLYVGSADVRAIGGRGLQEIEQLAGPLTLQIRTLAGTTWDTTFTVVAGVAHRIGYRPPRCQ